MVGALAAADLVDEYRLLVQPLVLGLRTGLVRPASGATALDLVDAMPFPSGIVVHVYRPQHT